jgi:hypothetical protein
VYILNALYLAPITLWTYLKYGRPVKPVKMMKAMDLGSESEKKPGAGAAPHEHHMSGHEHMNMRMAGEHHGVNGESHMNHDGHHHDMAADPEMAPERAGHMHHGDHNMSGMNHMDHNMERYDMSGMNDMNHNMEGHHMSEETPPTEKHEQPHDMSTKSHDMSHMDHAAMDHAAMNHGAMDHGAMNHSGMNHGAMHNMHMPSPDQPMFPTVTIAVCHCGAGCLLGDIVGEWLVFGTNATLGGRSIGPEFLIGNFSAPTPPSHYLEAF